MVIVLHLLKNNLSDLLLFVPPIFNHFFYTELRTSLDIRNTLDPGNREAEDDSNIRRAFKQRKVILQSELAIL